jgi:hypothetical protein
MDELTVVTRMRADLPPADLAGPELRLAAEISAPGTNGHKPRASHGHWYKFAAAVAAAAATATVVAVQAGHSRPDTATAVNPGRTAAAVPGPATTMEQLVAYAARTAAAEPAFDPRPHQWIYTQTLQAASSAGEGGMLFGRPDERATFAAWSRVDGKLVASYQDGKLVIRRSDVGVSAKNGTPALSMIGFPDTAYLYLDSLATDPAKLRAIIIANLKSQGSTADDVDIFNAIQALTENKVLSPRLYAGLYGVLAALPDVHFDRSVTDIAGRKALGLYTVQEGYLKDEIMINARTYAYMGEQYVALRAHTDRGTDGIRHIKKGQILGWSALLKSGIVNRPGQVPGD